jgi:hypothetical protein
VKQQSNKWIVLILDDTIKSRGTEVFPKVSYREKHPGFFQRALVAYVLSRLEEEYLVIHLHADPIWLSVGRLHCLFRIHGTHLDLNRAYRLKFTCHMNKVIDYIRRDIGFLNLPPLNLSCDCIVIDSAKFAVIGFGV